LSGCGWLRGGEERGKSMAMTEWDDAEFARHCARLRQLKQERGWLTDAEWDELATEKQLATLDRLIEERKKKNDEAAEPVRGS